MCAYFFMNFLCWLRITECNSGHILEDGHFYWAVSAIQKGNEWAGMHGPIGNRSTNGHCNKKQILRISSHEKYNNQLYKYECTHIRIDFFFQHESTGISISNSITLEIFRKIKTHTNFNRIYKCKKNCFQCKYILKFFIRSKLFIFVTY